MKKEIDLEKCAIRQMSDFTSSASCKKYAAFNKVEAVTNTKDLAFDRAVTMRDIIRGVFSGKFDITEVNEELTSEGIESGYALSATNEAMAKKEARAYQKYLRCEDPKTLKAADMEYIYLGNDQILAFAPDAIRVKENLVEAIIYKAGNPAINQRTGYVEEKPENMKLWFKLWVAQKYALDYAQEHLNLKKGDLYTVKGSYYYMKKTTDNRIPYDNDFFSGNGGNIVSLAEEYTWGVDAGKTDADMAFEKFMEQADAGFECSGDDCKYCNAKAYCNFSKPPVKLQLKEQKKRARVTPSEAQQKAIDAVEGIFKLNATAGSGKTETVTERTVNIIQKMMKEEGLSAPEAAGRILHISFTDAAVGEMKERIVGKCLAADIPLCADDIECYTFNAFANKAIGHYFDELGYAKAPGILKPDREMAYIENILEENPIDAIDAGAVSYIDGVAIPSVIINASKVFGFIKSHQIDPDADDAVDELISMMRDAGIYKSLQNDTAVSDLLDCYKIYDAQLKEDCLVTFADQEPLMFKVLELHPEYFEDLGYAHILVDEFQDTNEVQVTTLKRLAACKCFKSLMVVGDDSQAIYAFRDTTPEYIINFDQYIGQDVTDLFLSENRRSTPEICALANKVNDLNVNKVEKDMEAVRESGKEPVIKGFYEEKDETTWIADQIAEKVKGGVNPYEIAYLDPMKKGLVKMGTLLTERGIPWVMKNPMNLQENSRVIAALSLADAFYQPEASILYFNYLAAKYNGNIEAVDAAALNAEILDLQALFSNIDLQPFNVQQALFHEKLEALRGEGQDEDELYDYFLDLLYENEDLPSELAYTRIFKKYGSKMAKKMDQSYEGVVLCTIHSAKGLEWPVVYCSVTNLDAERLHNKRRNKDAVQMEIEEKRRLLFVAITRARDELYLTGKYVAFGPKDDRTFNQFLRELYRVAGKDKEYIPIDPMEAVRDAERKEAAKKRAKERYAKQKALNAAKVAGTNGSVRKGEMTEQEKRDYNAMIAGWKQPSLFDFI